MVSRRRAGFASRRTMALGVGVTAAMLVALMGAGGLVGAGEESIGAQVWIDDPIDGALVEPGTVSVTAHLTHPSGVDTATVAVDGEVVAEPDADGTLAVVQVDVELAEGEHVIEVRGGRGDQLSSATVTVFAGDPRSDEVPAETGDDAPPPEDQPVDLPDLPGDELAFPELPGSPTGPGPSPTTAAPNQPTTTTPTPTASLPCNPAVPQATSPIGGAQSFGTTITFNWSYSGCQPSRFEVRAGHDRTFTRVDVSESVGGGARSLSASFPCIPADWFWQVRAVGASASAWSGTATFGRVCRT